MLRCTGGNDAKHIEEVPLTRSAKSFLEDRLEGTAGDEQGTACAGWLGGRSTARRIGVNNQINHVAVEDFEPVFGMSVGTS
jgi:hypothetical protein